MTVPAPRTILRERFPLATVKTNGQLGKALLCQPKKKSYLLKHFDADAENFDILLVLSSKKSVHIPIALGTASVTRAYATSLQHEADDVRHDEALPFAQARLDPRFAIVSTGGLANDCTINQRRCARKKKRSNNWPLYLCRNGLDLWNDLHTFKHPGKHTQ